MRVLVVEDFELIRDSVTQGLREAGFAVDATGDGEEGWWYLKSHDYDVVVLDLMLPGVDGLTILKRLRASQSKTHVLLLTARDTAADRVRGLELGADDYLVKPFIFAELLARVRALVRRRYDTKDPVLRIEDLSINTVARTVKRGGQSIDLSSREYALLELLAVRAGQVVSRTDIWGRVYEADSEPFSNAADVLVGRLRRKVDLPGTRALIHTRRGFGYQLGESD